MPTWTKSPIPGIVDPYLYWADETEDAYLGGNGGAAPLWIPIIIELKGGEYHTAPKFAALVAEKRQWHHAIRVSPLYAAPPASLEEASYCTALVTRSFFEPEIMADPDLRASIQRFEIGLPVPGYATPPPKRRAAAPEKKAKKKKKAPQRTVITAVIDDGLGFANEVFRQGIVSTRVEYFWNQDTPAELTRNAIDNALAGCNYGGLVDEDELYAQTGNMDFTKSVHKPIAQRAAHGTHVMDLACGGYPPAAIQWRPLIGVQLPVATTADTSGATLTPQALDAFWYILNRADSLLAAPARVVVNLSYGTVAGPHDGSSVLEKAIDEMVKLRHGRLRVVLPAGNSFLARSHARFDLASGGEQLLRWRVQPDDRTPSFQEIWLPRGTKQIKPQVELKIIPPGGDQSDWIREGEEHIWHPGNDLLCKVLYLQPGAGRARSMIFIALAPTATLHASREVAPCGTWMIRIRNRVAHTTTIDAWIQRDDTPFGYPRRARQSRFDDPEYEYRDNAGREVELDNHSYVKRAGTINALATGKEAIVVGGYRRSDKRAAKYSASGAPPTAHGGIAIRSPDAMAVSDDSHVADGVLAAGSRSGSVVAINGTSVAAPQVTRWVALRMAANQPSGRPEVQSQATANPAIPAERAGAGLIEFPPRVGRQIEP